MGQAVLIPTFRSAVRGCRPGESESGPMSSHPLCQIPSLSFPETQPIISGARVCACMTVIDIRIELKKGVADPEGANTMKTLTTLGFQGIEAVRAVKVYEVTVDLPADEAVKAGEEYCRTLLANPVVQSYSVSLRE